MFEYVKSTINGNFKKNDSNDPSGILNIILKYTEAILSGLRYYPVLVSLRNNQIFISLTSCALMWIDFSKNIIQFGNCETIISNELKKIDDKELIRRLWLYIAYKIMYYFPIMICSSFILSVLTYRLVIDSIDFIFRNNSRSSRLKADCLMCHLNDESEVIYSNYDLNYVIELFEQKNIKTLMINENDYKQLKFLKIINIKKKKIFKLLNFIYKWDSTYRFSSRFVNSIVFTLFVLYYFILYFSYLIIVNLTFYLKYLPDSLQEGFINVGQEFCNFDKKYCFDFLMNFKIPIENNISNYIPSKPVILSIFVIPLFVAAFICLSHIFLLIKETKYNIKSLHKGKCKFIDAKNNMNHGSIVSRSLRFGG
jgi:hypothetical protein